MSATPSKRSRDASPSPPLPATKKFGGRSRPAALLLMFEPLGPAAALDEPEYREPEQRPLDLLLTDAETGEYVCEELHDCRVRCVLDSIESRGIVYRARRMQARVAHHLARDRAEVVRVFRARVQALQATGRFDPGDMQVIRGHLAMLEQSQGNDFGGRSSPRGLQGPPQQMPNRDVERALVCLSARFALPEEFASSAEFGTLCRALLAAQTVEALPSAFSEHAGYGACVDRQLQAARDSVCARMRGAAHYSVALHAEPLLGTSAGSTLLGIAVIVDTAAYTLDWIVADSGDSDEAVAQQVFDALQQLDSPGAAPPLAIVSSGSTPLACRVRELLAGQLGCGYHMPGAAQMLDALGGSVFDSGGVAATCAASLVNAAQAIAGSPAAHRQWIERRGRRVALPARIGQARELLPLFQQMVAADYDLLLELKHITGDSEHFDELLDRANAPMFLALVQTLALLGDCVHAVTRPPRGSLADLAVVLARLEVTLEDEQVSAEMHAAARGVLSALRRANALVAPYAALAHSLSLYPQETVRAAPLAPLTLSQMLGAATTLHAALMGTDSAEPSLPAMHANWDVFRKRADAASAAHAADLPAVLSAQRIFELAELAPAAHPELAPMPLLAAVLNDGPVSVPLALERAVAELAGGGLEDRIRDPLRHRELLVAAMTRDLDAASQPVHSPDAVSVAQHHHHMLTFCSDLADAPAGNGDEDDEATTAIIAAFDEPLEPIDPAALDHGPDHFAQPPASLLCYFDGTRLTALL
ncbi:hypothetical protein IWW51_002039 [Coemansia sp. RSA 2702]|nr:hypothetical protein IWW51_002039 [Coemansia sp. RSA 2702]